ncbi:AAA family ATPase [Kribbella lupini]|uniref:Kinase n=1 Tax=Kribbella lupini TaxID=291602 RepID=A0ABP4MXJ2_9ACTN
MSLGTTESRLIVLRGNSGSGKSTTARQLRARLGRGTAIVEQDQIRRVLLWEKDVPGNAAIDLIGLNARYCLARGFDVIVEGIMNEDRYGDMLRGLTADHRGTTRHYYFDIPFEETLVRHATRSWAANVAPESMREWYEARDLLAGVEQHVFDEHQDLDAVLGRILKDLGLPPDLPADPGATSYGR